MVPGWIKALFAMILLTIGVFIVILLLPTCKKKTEQEKTYYDVIKEDDKRLRAEPNIKEVTASKTPVVSKVELPAAEAKLKFKELSEEEQVEAERLFEMALAARKMGRLPALTYGQMVDYCRQIIQRFPGSEYDFKAKRILADIPEQYRDQYKITAEEIDLSKWPRQ